MSGLCPICNSFCTVELICRHCGHQAQDLGRFTDMLGPYSPYRDIEDLEMTHADAASTDSACIHVCECPTCRESFLVGFNEWQG
jgi:hypothetical protein